MASPLCLGSCWGDILVGGCRGFVRFGNGVTTGHQAPLVIKIVVNEIIFIGLRFCFKFNKERQEAEEKSFVDVSSLLQISRNG